MKVNNLKLLKFVVVVLNMVLFLTLVFHSKVSMVEAASNPFSGKIFFVDSNSTARAQVNALLNSKPDDAKLLEKIASNPTAIWMGEWSGDIQNAVHNKIIQAGNRLPVFVAYNIPYRDCGSYSAGGLSSSDTYKQWINNFANGIGNNEAVVVLEPDALGLINCLSPSEQQSRYDLLRYAVTTFASKGKVSTYIDASTWVDPNEMAKRLKNAGIDEARGVSVNVSGFLTSESAVDYVKKLNQSLGRTVYGLIDSSRNGNGPSPNNEWCNPSGRALGNPPTANTNDSTIDAYFWIKTPGESDGTCNGGPSAGKWWLEYALNLARQTDFSKYENRSSQISSPIPSNNILKIPQSSKTLSTPSINPTLTPLNPVLPTLKVSSIEDQCITDIDGDLDCDGAVTEIDSELLLTAIKIKYFSQNLDFTGDGKLTLDDYEIFRQIYVKRFG